jgi:hypothetical protein
MRTIGILTRGFLILKALPITLILLLAACATPPKLSTALDVQKKADGLVVVKFKVTNLEDRATTPVNVEITGQARSNGQWTRSESLIHPTAFVLNRKEQREITKMWHIQADAVKTTVVIKEQENGNVLKSEKSEQVFQP